MRRVAAALALALLLTGCAGDDQPEVTTLPEVTLQGLQTPQDVDLASLKGPMVVNLFASVCGPCHQELPILEQFHQRHGDQVEVLGIDHNDPQKDDAVAMVSKTGVTYDVLHDPGAELSAAPPFPFIRGWPFTAFVDAEGTVVHMEFGVVKSLTELEQLVEEHLGMTL